MKNFLNLKNYNHNGLSKILIEKQKNNKQQKLINLKIFLLLFQRNPLILLNLNPQSLAKNGLRMPKKNPCQMKIKMPISYHLCHNFDRRCAKDTDKMKIATTPANITSRKLN
jgi:hypothetical protein